MNITLNEFGYEYFNTRLSQLSVALENPTNTDIDEAKTLIQDMINQVAWAQVQ